MYSTINRAESGNDCDWTKAGKLEKKRCNHIHHGDINLTAWHCRMKGNPTSKSAPSCQEVNGTQTSSADELLLLRCTSEMLCHFNEVIGGWRCQCGICKKLMKRQARPQMEAWNVSSGMTLANAANAKMAAERFCPIRSASCSQSIFHFRVVHGNTIRTVSYSTETENPHSTKVNPL